MAGPLKPSLIGYLQDNSKALYLYDVEYKWGGPPGTFTGEMYIDAMFHCPVCRSKWWQTFDDGTIEEVVPEVKAEYDNHICELLPK